MLHPLLQTKWLPRAPSFFKSHFFFSRISRCFLISPSSSPISLFFFLLIPIKAHWLGLDFSSTLPRFPLCFCPVVLFFSYCTHFCLCLVILQAQRNDAAASRVRPLRRRMFLINIYIFIWTAECEATSSTLFIVTLRLWVRACFFSLETKLKFWHDYRKSNNGTSSPETNSKKPKSSVKVCTQLLMWHLCIFIKVSP